MSLPTTVSETYRAADKSITALQSRIQGQVLTPDAPQYEEARLGFNRSVDQHPALIVVAASAQDIAEAVQFARQEQLGVAVQSTGHGTILPADGGMLLLTSQLKELKVNASARTAWVGAGLRWGEVLVRTQEAGLAPLLGSSPGVGVVGYTLGGGLGWLGRKYGLATDSVLAFELVNADGQLLRASRTENTELYWALRGGGGSFGVITGMEIQLYPVDRVYGGNLTYPAEYAREVMQRYREWIRSAPDELTTSVVLINFPPIPQLPEMLRGKSFVMVRGCYAGPVEEGEALMKYWRDWKLPLIDDFKAMPFRDVANISNDPVNPAPSFGSGAWMRDLSDAAIDTLLSYTLPQGAPPALTMVEVRHAGGAISRVAPGTSAYSHRDSDLLLFCVGGAPTPEAFERVGNHVSAMKKALEPSLTGGVYMNFVAGQEAYDRTKDGYAPDAFRRLQSLKLKIDPGNTFRFSFNIAPRA